MRSSSISNSDSQKSHSLNPRSRTKSPPNKLPPVNPAQQSSSLRLRVDGICKDASLNHLSEIFSTFGEVTSCRFPKDDNKHLSRRYAIIEYSKINEAEIALRLMDGAEINGTPLSVRFSEKEPEEERERSREKEKDRKSTTEESKKQEETKEKKQQRLESSSKEKHKNGQEPRQKEPSRTRPNAGRYTKHEKREEDSSDSSSPRKRRDSSRGSSRSSSSSLSSSSENSSG